MILQYTEVLPDGTEVIQKQPVADRFQAEKFLYWKIQDAKDLGHDIKYMKFCDEAQTPEQA